MEGPALTYSGLNSANSRSVPTHRSISSLVALAQTPPSRTPTSNLPYNHGLTATFAATPSSNADAVVCGALGTPAVVLGESDGFGLPFLRADRAKARRTGSHCCSRGARQRRGIGDVALDLTGHLDVATDLHHRIEKRRQRAQRHRRAHRVDLAAAGDTHLSARLERRLSSPVFTILAPGAKVQAFSRPSSGLTTSWKSPWFARSTSAWP